jgi:hypothetical protein
MRFFHKAIAAFYFWGREDFLADGGRWGGIQRNFDLPQDSLTHF